MKTPIIAALALSLSAGAASAQSWETPAAADAAQRVLSWPSITQAQIVELATPIVERLVKERGMKWHPDLMSKYIGTPLPVVLPPELSGTGYEPYIEACSSYSSGFPQDGLFFDVLLTYQPTLGYRATVLTGPDGASTAADLIACAMNTQSFKAQ